MEYCLATVVLRDEILKLCGTDFDVFRRPNAPSTADVIGRQISTVLNTMVVEGYSYENRAEFDGFRPHEYYQSSDIMNGYSLCEVDQEHRFFGKLKDEINDAPHL